MSGYWPLADHTQETRSYWRWWPVQRSPGQRSQSGSVSRWLAVPDASWYWAEDTAQVQEQNSCFTKKVQKNQILFALTLGKYILYTRFRLVPTTFTLPQGWIFLDKHVSFPSSNRSVLAVRDSGRLRATLLIIALYSAQVSLLDPETCILILA